MWRRALSTASSSAVLRKPPLDGVRVLELEGLVSIVRVRACDAFLTLQFVPLLFTPCSSLVKFRPLLLTAE